MKLRSAILAICVGYATLARAGKPTPPPAPSAMVFGSFDNNYGTEIHESLWFRLASITFTRSMTIPEDGAWLYGDAVSSSAYPNTICGKKWVGGITPQIAQYTPFFRLGTVPGDVCGPTGYCLACGVRFGGLYHSPRRIILNNPGTYEIVVVTENGGGMNDEVQFWLAQTNRNDMEKMTIYRAKSETDPSPATPDDLAGEYFVANSPDEVLVVPKFHRGHEFPAGPGLTYTATWDSGATSTISLYTPTTSGVLGTDTILGVGLPKKLPTGKHTFTVTATLPSGKTYTSNGLEVFVYAQTIYVTYDAFDEKNPVDDLPSIVPGSTSSGADVDLRSGAQMLQLNVLVGRGSSGAFTVKLTNISRHLGIAMNYPLSSTDISPDIDFGGGTTELTSVTIPKGGKPVVVKLPLYIRDYGASATIEVTMPYRKTTFTSRRRIPFDANGNGLPDAGWRIGTTQVGDAGLNMTSDDDDDGDPATLYKGDGFSAFEEYRGVFQDGAFTRLNPRRRDLFIFMDQALFAIPESPTSRLLTLPVMVHFVNEDEVSGEDYAPRALTKTKPVVNTNRTDIPGARVNGQRAVRVIRQTDLYPKVPRISYALGDVVNVPAPQAGIFGMTLLDVQDPNVPESNMPPGGFTAQTPDATRSVELFEETYLQAGIHTAFDFGPFGYYDENGNPTEPCIGPGTPENCDLFDLVHHMIRPFQLGDGYFAKLHTIPSYSDDYYTIPGQRCDFPGMIFDGGFTDDHVAAQRGAVVTHEIGHAIHIDHNAACGTTMYYRIPDTAPPPTSFNAQERGAVRLWQ